MGKRTDDTTSSKYARWAVWVPVIGIIVAILVSIPGGLAAILALDNHKWEAFKSCFEKPFSCFATLNTALGKPPKERDPQNPEGQPGPRSPNTKDDKIYVYTGETKQLICGQSGWRAYEARINQAGNWYLSKDSLDGQRREYVDIGKTITIGACDLKLTSVDPPDSNRTESLLTFVRTAP